MNKTIIKFLIFTTVVFCCLFSPGNITFAQDKNCDLNTKVFNLKDVENPQKYTVSDFKLTLVNLSDNKLILPETINKQKIYKNLKNGSYNLVVEKADFIIENKIIYIDCRLVDKSNNFIDYFYLFEKGKSFDSVKNKIYYSLRPTKAKPLLKGAAGDDSKDFGFDVSSEIVNDRAVFLPTPILNNFGTDYLKRIKASGSFLRITAYVIIDKKGNVVYYKPEANNEKYFKNLEADVAQVKFVPLVFEGKNIEFSGYIYYIL